MRVLFLTHSFPRFSGDAPGSFLHRLAVALRDENVDVHVIAPAAAGLARMERIDGIPVERFRYAPRSRETLAYTGTMAQDVAGSWGARFAMAGYMGAGLASGLRARRRIAPDVIHAHWWFPSGVLAAAVGRFSGTPLVTTMHGSDVRLARDIPVCRPAFRHVMKRSSRVTVVSRWLASEASTVMPGLASIVAPMPAATERFTPGGSRPEDRFLFVGRLNAQKGLGLALRAMAHLPRATLDVVGDGPDRESLGQLANDRGVAERIVWHGQLAQGEIADFYRSATALVVPSTDEGLGLVAAEALLCETPVIAFRSGGLPDVIEHERTGLLVQPGDEQALAAAMQRILDRPSEARTMAEAGRASAMAAFSPEAVARRYAGIYRDATVGKG